ncbi:DUF3842 family protein [Flexilinea flocculi]|jgi:hypothetical protein|uniref:DUF3842 family protein n=1 Tax=Flexilinea flocculi TaxID=1678840 RepID=A0A0S7BSE8_9CHLR|nr:DUF3842 family protein [Flexilinea flocculi]GAP41403.1 hypothetical protein ATC1_131392 [Flexilinea flocculi]
MKIVVIDGQGGSLGKIIVTQLKKYIPGIKVHAIGTNSIATLAMRKAGADYCASGENPVIVACEDADIIIGPMGIIAADSLLGEITPAMANAIGKSKAHKILIPVSKCKITVAGVQDLPYNTYIDLAVENIKMLIESENDR